MAWGFYELSGGSDFEAPERVVRTAKVLDTYDVPVTRSRTTLVATAPSIAESATPAVANVEAPATSEATQASYTPTVVETTVVETGPTSTHKVAGNRVNMRNGPSTDYGILAKLSKGDEVEVLEENDNGWSRLRVAATGQEGWMASRLLTAN